MPIDVGNSLSLAAQCHSDSGLIKQRIDLAEFWRRRLHLFLCVLDRGVAGNAGQLPCEIRVVAMRLQILAGLRQLFLELIRARALSR